MADLRKLSKDELSQILAEHKLWIDSRRKEGNRAVLSNTNLRDTYLRNSNLGGADLSGADLSGANLIQTILQRANLRYANISNAQLMHTDFRESDIFHGNLSSSDLRKADLSEAFLYGANLSKTDLSSAIISYANLANANLENAVLLRSYIDRSDLDNCNFKSSYAGLTSFSNLNLSNVVGLDTVKHEFSSSISIDTFIRSKGKIPKVFLRGCGVPDEWIDYIPLLTGQAIQYFSCFISYSHLDEEFAQKLYGDLQNAGIRCWYAPEEMKGGKKLHDQIFEAIKLHDKLVIILSENSMNSEWVKTEIRRTRKSEKESRKQKLFPISLVDYNLIKEWECFDAEIGKDIGIEIREYFIPDFTKWKNHDQYKEAFERLVKDLKSTMNSN